MENKSRLTAATIQERGDIYERVTSGDLSLGESVKELRRITGLTQKEFAEKIVKVYPRLLSDIERDTANPTKETLDKIGRIFGLRTGFVPFKEKH